MSNTLEYLTGAPRLFGLANPQQGPGCGFLLVVKGYAHVLDTDDTRRVAKAAVRRTPKEFLLAEDGSCAILDSSSTVMGMIVIRPKSDERPSTWASLDLVEYNVACLGELRWMEPTQTFVLGRYTYTGELPDRTAADV